VKYAQTSLNNDVIFEQLFVTLMTTGNVEWPIALVESRIKDQRRLAASFLPASGGAFAKALAALALRNVCAVVNAGAHTVALVGCSGRGGRESGLEGAVLVMFVTNGSFSTIHSLRPVAPVVGRIVIQLLAILKLTNHFRGNVL